MRLLRLASVLLASLASLPAATETGLALELSSGGKVDTRRDRLAALHVPAGQPPSVFLPAGPFKARWEGILVSDLRMEVRFHAALTGQVVVAVNGQTVLEGAEGKAVTLNKGDNPLVIEYAAPASGDATFRLDWSSRSFPREPVPPEALRHDPTKVAAGMRLREGRLLFAQLRCAQCHVGADKVPGPGQGMPELSQGAPILANYGERMKESYLAAWIQDPHHFRPGTLMPRVFPAGKDGAIDPRAADLAAFLVSQGTPAPEPAFTPAQAAKGAALFANLGCLACHTQPDAAQVAGNRLPLGHLAAKWHGAALVDYLLDPAKGHASARMPNFRLSSAEASELAAYLLANAKGSVASAPKGDPARGAALLVGAGCMNCHANAPIGNHPSLADTVAKGWDKGCVADGPASRGKGLDFALTPSQLAALRAFAKTDFASLRADVPAEFALRQLSELRCVQCHEHDGRTAPLTALKDEAAALRSRAPAPAEGEGQPFPDARIPALTWLGEKLRPEWSAAFIAGEIPAKPRYWMTHRMPGYPAQAKLLAEGLSHQHGFPVKDPEPAAVDTEAAGHGETLIGPSGGFNCLQCHPVSTRPATAAFEAPATNLATATQRLRETFYARWMLAPTRVDPLTKMPKYADEEGMTQLTDILDGEAEAQFKALWEHLRTVEAK
jgi:cytochrome c551/c552